MIIKPILENEFEKMTSIVQSAYGGSFNGTTEEKERLIPIFKEMVECDDVIPLGAYEGDEMIGAVLHYDFKTNFHDTMLPSAGIGMLAVDLLHKKKGVAKALLQHSMALSEKKHVPLYYLYPFSTEFYRNFGFGYGVPVYTYMVRPEDFYADGDKSILSYSDKKDLDLIFDFYDYVAKKTNGMSLRTYSDKRRIKKMKAGKILIARQLDCITGYMIYSQKGLNPDNNQSQKIVVNEMLYDDHKTLLAFTKFFSDQVDQVDYIEIATFDENFHYVLKNTKFAPKPQTLEMISLKVADQSLGLMPYALNPAELLESFKNKVKETVIFEIVYPKEQIQKYTLKGSDDTIQIKVTINEFSSWVTGVVGLKSLYDHGKLSTDAPDRLKNMDHSFHMDKPKSYTKY